MSATDITDEMIEQGRKALTFGIMGCGCCGENPPDELDHLDFDVARAHVAARAALEAVLPGIIQQAKAEALARLGRAAYAVDSTHHFHDIQCSCGFTGDARKRTQTEHITTAVLEAYDHD